MGGQQVIPKSRAAFINLKKQVIPRAVLNRECTVIHQANGKHKMRVLATCRCQLAQGLHRGRGQVQCVVMQVA